jgi:alkylhydroperoxidase/carboxymuconolactone decarboxylase family protein YurZ
VIAETEFAKLAGATEREIAEAVGMAALTRPRTTTRTAARAARPVRSSDTAPPRCRRA